MPEKKRVIQHLTYDRDAGQMSVTWNNGEAEYYNEAPDPNHTYIQNPDGNIDLCVQWFGLGG